MNTVDTHIFSIQVAKGDNTFGFNIELVDIKSSTNCKLLQRILPYHCLLFSNILFYWAKVELYVSLD